ncbi:hypothetical protein A3A37_02235 [Candidatus Kaiserbacteria bacterium RIFCSPLOWO2_01_FULL_52_36]|nr:MAG: hypothetical protein A3A37_02235 [Candidatus Kaiserbacteria bacterium RIFCSPLOWO2_01_FULL_52_36]
MDIGEIRTKYLEFFKKRGHAIIPSAPLLPENDPTTLFTGSGMQPLVPYLLGLDHPAGKRLVNSQKCFRALDIDEVGDNRHTTFFEMLGNWSLGDYFKKEQLPFIFEFLTKEIGIPKERLWVTCFEGDEKLNLPRDTESAGIWKDLGIPQERIRFYDSKKNWWSRAGVPENMPAGEPGGPDSEIFYDFKTPHDAKYGKECHPNCDCGRFLEIGNSVFMQYIKKEDGSFALLPKQNVDFGGGVERIAAAANDNPDIFATDVFEDIIQLLEHYSDEEKPYTNSTYTKSYRIIADHIRAATFMIADGVRPSNTERGYILRRLIRRATQHATALGAAQGQARENELVRAASFIIEKYKMAYPELDGEQAYENIANVIWQEEKQFARTLEKGMREFEKIVMKDVASDPYENEAGIKGRLVLSIGTLAPETVFKLVTTYGLPIELVEEIALAKGLTIDREAFQKEMQKHTKLSRAGAEQKFKGGLADHSEATTRLHTAHHLLLKALQLVLGTHVKQRGSNITAERLRIDFSHPAKMTPEQIAEVEQIVNEKIREKLPVICSTLPKEEAEKLGAEHEFGVKYPDMVSVYSVGPKTATPENPRFAEAFSIEFCGGPHVKNTRDLKGTFKIQKEEAVAAGIRRIKAVLL